MITKFYLAGIEIEQPEGINGLYLERIRDKVFGGFIRNRTTSVKGIGSITITDLEVCQILKLEFDANGIDGVTEFRIEQNDEAVYLAEVDYGQYSVNHNGHVTISLRDPEGIVQFDTNVAKEYEIEPTVSIFLDKTELTGKATHTVGESNIVSRGQPNGSPFLFSVPLKVSVKDSVTNGIGLDVIASESVISPFWQNTDTKPVNVAIGGYLAFTATSSSTDQVRVYLANRINGVVANEILILEFQTNMSITSKTVIIDKYLTVAVGGDVCLLVKGSGSVQGYNYTFQTADVSVIQDLEIKGSDVFGMNASLLMGELIEKVSDGKLTFIDLSLIGKYPFITNGLCLRGNKANIKTSFLKLFMGLSKIYNLIITIENNVVYLKSKEENYKSSGAFPLENDSSITLNSKIKTAMSDKFLTEIKTGYTEWKSDTVTGNLEFNSPRVYDTTVKKSKSVLDITVNEMVASGKIIEKQRRLQYEILKSSEKTDDKNDNTLFIIDTDGVKSILGKNGINEGINPVFMLRNIANEYGHCKNFIYRTGEGNVNEEIAGERQSGDLEGLTGYFTGMQVMIEGSCNLMTYLSFGDKVTIDFEGKQTDIWIEEDLYRLQTNNFTIKGLEIK